MKVYLCGDCKTPHNQNHLNLLFKISMLLRSGRTTKTTSDHRHIVKKPIKKPLAKKTTSVSSQIEAAAAFDREIWKRSAMIRQGWVPPKTYSYRHVNPPNQRGHEDSFRELLLWVLLFGITTGLYMQSVNQQRIYLHH